MVLIERQHCGETCCKDYELEICLLCLYKCICVYICSYTTKIRFVRDVCIHIGMLCYGDYDSM